jgi:hypothetical protein
MAEDSTVLVAFRLDAELVKKLDAYKEAIAAKNPGLYTTRTDAVRMLLIQGLEMATQRKSKKS